MSFILNIDTALSVASVCISKNDESIVLTINKQQHGHAAWLHQTIKDSLEKAGCSISQLEAVAVSIGPGSYTGLRIGLSSAKGLCYALKIPLITIKTTEMLASAVKNEAEDLICPAIDARRMEIFTAVYDKELNEIKAPHALIISENSFQEYLADHKILFCGDGHKKFQSVLVSKQIDYSDHIADASHLSTLAIDRFRKKKFADIAYSEPLYVKEFYST